jgi:hypothetical protein
MPPDSEEKKMKEDQEEEEEDEEVLCILISRFAFTTIEILIFTIEMLIKECGSMALWGSDDEDITTFASEMVVQRKENVGATLPQFMHRGPERSPCAFIAPIVPVPARLRRLGVVLGLRVQTPDFVNILRECTWKERRLEWQGELEIKREYGCGFDAPDMYTDFTQSEQPKSEWVVCGSTCGSEEGRVFPTAEAPHDYVLCCAVDSPVEEDRDMLWSRLLAVLKAHYIGVTVCMGYVRVVLVTACPYLPLLPLPKGLLSMRLDTQHPNAIHEARRLLSQYGMLVVPNALDNDTAGEVYRVAKARARALEVRLAEESLELGGYQAIKFAEVCSRGPRRWDQLLVTSDGELTGTPDSDACAILHRVATQGPWVNAVRDALGEDCTWQCSCVWSRPGATAGAWHADGGHGKFVYGEGCAPDAPYALCVFVPLVDLSSPHIVISGDGTHTTATHGLGCTHFWPGTHTATNHALQRTQ